MLTIKKVRIVEDVEDEVVTLSPQERWNNAVAKLVYREEKNIITFFRSKGFVIDEVKMTSETIFLSGRDIQGNEYVGERSYERK